MKALILDVDGTLADTEEAHRWAFNAAFSEFSLGWVWDTELYGQLLSVAGGKERMRHYLEQIGSDERSRPDLDDFIGRLHARKTQIYADLLAEGGVPLRPGVERLINEARSQGIRLGIATTTSASNITALFKSTIGIEAIKWFDAIGAGGRVEKLKPSPDVYKLVLEVLGLEPSACLAIEDSANGLRASRGAGIGAVITTSTYTAADDFSGALAVLDGLGEPDSPFTVIEGDAFGEDFVDVELLRKWHGQGG